MTRTAESRRGPYLGRGAAHSAATLMLAAFGTLVTCLSIIGAESGPSRTAIQTPSTAASRVTGGEVLVQITMPPGTPVQSVKVTVAGRDVTDSFRPATSNTMVGLVTGLVAGKNTLL